MKTLALLGLLVFSSSAALAANKITIHVTCLSGKAGKVDCPMEKTVQQCGSSFCHPAGIPAKMEVCFNGAAEVRCAPKARITPSKK